MVRTRSQRIRHAAEGRLTIKTVKVRERSFSSLGYDAELPMRVCQLEGLDTKCRELEYAHYFYESFFRVFMRNLAERERMNESDSEGEGGFEQFPGFPGQLVSYPPGSDAFKEFCKAKGAIRGKWEYGLSLSLTNLAKGIMNATEAGPVQLNGKTWEVITVCDHLNERWEKEQKLKRISPEDVLQFYRGNCLQQDDEELLDVRFRSVKQSVKSIVERKESLLDEVAEEETELKLVLGEFGLSRKKRVESRSKKIQRALPASGTTISGEVAKGKRRRVEPLGDSREKVAEGRSASVDDLKEVEERAGLTILHGKEDTSCSSCQGDLARYRRAGVRAKKAKSELEKNLARAKTEVLSKVRQWKAAHTVAIVQLQVEAKANLDKMAEEHDQLEGEETEALGVVDGLDGVSPQTVLDNQGDNVELPKGGSEKVVREMSLRINDLESGLAREREILKALMSARAELQALERSEEQCRSDLHRCRIDLERMRLKFIGKDDELKHRCDDLNERVARLKSVKDQAIARAKKAEARVRSGGSRIKKGNANLRECQHKLDAALIREKFLEGEIKTKDLMVKRKEELLKDLPAREELNAEIMKLCARVVDLEATNVAESLQYIAKLKEDSIYHDRVDNDIIAWKDNFARLKICLVRLKVRFTAVIVPGISRSDLLRVIVTYFVKEAKRLKSERDTLLKTLTDKGCTGGAMIDRGNCLGTMETQLGPQTAELVEQGKAVVARKLKDRPLDDVGESIADTPSAEKKSFVV
ncbi:hypothetical protein GIB67_038025 [Kingdonia uniflora]|uniref:Uncharacterized protein n=1 Tax=Kingdonia uniflora TaxID=39325 RepID=A0A7J7MC46_9MAGN|nr:hypothetical protein GIB67_038025 [Kingdonia uniflora]